MPTQSTTYNTRLTDEGLEKRFRDTFRSQGGAELVDDLYASGVIVPVVDFTAAAEGSQLPQNLQTAWDLSTQSATVQNTTTTIVSTTGFWAIDFTMNFNTSTGGDTITMTLNDGLTIKNIFQIASNGQNAIQRENPLVVFVRTGQTIKVISSGTAAVWRGSWRQVADVYGNLTDPLGWVSS